MSNSGPFRRIARMIMIQVFDHNDTPIMTAMARIKTHILPIPSMTTLGASTI